MILRFLFTVFLSFSLLSKTGYSASASGNPLKTNPPAVHKKSEEAVARYRQKEAQKDFLERKKSRYATAEQFSGALQWAHKKLNIRGHGQTAIVLERENHSISITRKMGDQFLVSPNLKRTKHETDHATTVIDAINRVAPKSHVVLLSTAFDLTRESYQSLLTLNKKLQKWVSSSSILNFSHGLYQKTAQKLASADEEKYFSGTRSFKATSIKQFKSLLQYGKPKLLFHSAGNEKLSLSDPLVTTKLGEVHRMDAILNDSFLRNRLIIVGGLNQFFEDSATSNYPGKNKKIQKHFIFTLGRNIKLLSNGENSLKHGTSFASPIAAGCALLLMEKFPTLSVGDIKEVLLESASKSFFIDQGKVKGKDTGIFVYDPEGDAPNLSTFSDLKKYNIRAEPFNPELYGRGVLDLRAAFQYAHLKTKNIHLSPKQILFQMKRILKKEEKEAALKIQRFFRSYWKKK